MSIRKFCTLCEEPLVSLSSINVRKCSGCRHDHPWHLDPGQKSVLIEGLCGDEDPSSPPFIISPVGE